TFADVARDILRVLRPSGTVRFVADNRWFPSRFADRAAERSLRPHTLNGYRRALRQVGYSTIRIFAPLPRHTRVPLCLLPLDSPGALAAFLRELFPVFATVSPEVKQAHALEYALARAGVWAMR